LSAQAATLKGVRGMPDILPPQSSLWQALEQTVSAWMRRSGFQQIRLPYLEELAVFQRSVGSSSDIVRKEMYTLTDHGDRLLGLRPDGTAGVVRAAIEHGLIGAPGVERRLWYLGPMFRYERPQKGRLRQFHQFGAELFGVASPYVDAEMIELNVQILIALGVGDLHVEINSLGGEGSRTTYRQRLVGFARKHEDDLCSDCHQRLDVNPLRILDCKNADCQAIYADAPTPLSSLDDEDSAHFQAVREGLDAIGVAYHVQPRLVRGLDYYTRTVFEIKAGGLGAQDTVSAGGRYDGLVAEFGGKPTPALGFAAGIERILLAAQGALQPPASRPQLVWIAQDEAARVEALRWLPVLRRAGLHAEHAWHKGSLKAQMRAANAVEAEVVLVRGQAERDAGEVVLRHLPSGKEERVALARDAILAVLAAWTQP